MADTPPKKEGVEPELQSPDDSSSPMDHSREAQDTQAHGQYEVEVKEQDRWLPIANVARIMKNALPENAKIAREAKECMQECVSEFISFITSEASERCHLEKRKTVNGEDILFAMTSLGFENYSLALKIYLSRYRDTLVANQNKPAGRVNVGGTDGVVGENSGSDVAGVPNAVTAGYGSGRPNSNLLTGNLDGSEAGNNAAFGYDVSHSNGTDY